jgi:hypothetical protein
VRRRRASLHDDRGVVGGAEVLAFGFLTFVIGALLIANAWGILDAKIAVTAAAREAARAYVEAPSAPAAATAARQAATATMTGHGRNASTMGGPTLDGTFARCARITASVTYTVPAISLPWVGGFADTTVVGRHSEIVDPYRSGLEPEDPRGQEPDCA